MKNKKIVIVALILVIVLSVGLSIYAISKGSKKEDNENIIEGTKVYTSEENDIFKDQKVSSLDVTNMSLVSREEISTFKAVVTNNSEEEFTINNDQALYTIFYQGEEKTEVKALTETTIMPGTNTRVEVVIEGNLENVTKIELIIK